MSNESKTIFLFPGDDGFIDLSERDGTMYLADGHGGMVSLKTEEFAMVAGAFWRYQDVTAHSVVPQVGRN